MLILIAISLGLLGQAAVAPDAPVVVTVPFVEEDEIDLSELITRLADATHLEVARPEGDVTLPFAGLAGNLSRKMLGARLGREVAIATEGRALVLRIDPALLAPGRIDEWRGRVEDLANEARREARRRRSYGMHAMRSYRPNDPTRPTVCLVHGVNSSSGGFVHTIPPIERAGYGVVVYDYPYNRSLEESCERFARDVRSFRAKTGDVRPWALVGHSMGCLLARDFVERPDYRPGEVSALVMIAPVNRGSYLAKTQTLLQFLQGMQAANGRRTANALAHLGDGLGEAADDMTPGSRFLKALDARPRRAGVSYHIIAGDVGLITAAARRKIDDQIEAARRQGGLLGGLVRIAAAGGDIAERLDEITDGAGDGCVSVARTRLDGVTDHVVLHANHAELIRAPLLFADPGPVACMPELLLRLDAAGRRLGDHSTGPKP